MIDSKYKPRYAKQLCEGMRKDGKSIAEVCAEWGVAESTYERWRKEYPDFDEAHAIGRRDAAIWWHQLNRMGASGAVKVNAGLIQFALKNIEGINWADKVEVHRTSDEEIKTLRIEICPQPNYILPPSKGKVIDVESDED